MTFRFFAIAVSALSLGLVTTASATTKHHRHAQVLRPEAYAGPRARPSFDQPHMIQIRPGLWISSWDCIQDEGQGRWLPCSMGNAGRGGR
jgi:hypothetical protein